MATLKTAMGRRLSHATVVELLGDMTVLARALGIRVPNTVAHWKKPDRGIPPLYWAAIARIAQAQGFRITVEDLECTWPHPRTRMRKASCRPHEAAA